MNATSLYVSTCRLILQADTEDPQSWTDLYRLVPYLRQSLSCSVCSNLLIEPLTPIETNCQHHVCRECRGGRKKLKPSCAWCRDYDKYFENIQLRILLQCYKKLCEYLISTAIYRCLIFNNVSSNLNSNNANISSQNDNVDTSDSSNSALQQNPSTTSLVELIQEGAGFKDEFKSNTGLSKSAYSILPCVYKTSTISTQTQPNSSSETCNDLVTDNTSTTISSTLKTVSNGSSIYSVMYAGTGNKITIKRKAAVPVEENCNVNTVPVEQESRDKGEAVKCITASQLYNAPVSSKKSSKGGKTSGSFKKPRSSSVRNKRKGCRCGNATAIPGKLTCCGQRCPCYVESKPCIECRCRGCRNPHTPDGFKIRPHIPELHNLQLQLTAPIDCQKVANESLGTVQQCYTGTPQTIQLLNVYSAPKLNIDDIHHNLPALLVGEDNIGSTESEADDSDVQIDV